MQHPPPRRPVTRAAPAPARLAWITLSALALALPAQAALIDSISVSLVKPNGTEQFPLDNAKLTQLAPLATGIQALNLGGSGAIGSFMLDNEQISFSGDSIRIRVHAGSQNGLNPGFIGDARYEFSGIGVVGAAITGFNVFAFDGYATSGTSGLANPATAASLVSMNGAFNQLTLDLSNAMTFSDRFGGTLNFAEFRIDLISQVGPPPPPGVPEPGTLALVAAAGLGLALSRRSRAGNGD